MDWIDQSAICSPFEQELLQANAALVSPLFNQSSISYETPPVVIQNPTDQVNDTDANNSDGPISAYLFDPNSPADELTVQDLYEHFQEFGGGFLHDLFYATIINMSLTMLGEILIDKTPGASNHIPAVIYGSSIGIFKGTMTVMHLEEFKKLCLEAENLIYKNYFQPEHLLGSLGFTKETLSWINGVFMDEFSVLFFQTGVVKYQDILTDLKLSWYLDADDARELNAESQKYPERLVKIILRRLLKDCSKGIYDRIFEGVEEYTGYNLGYASAPLADITKYFVSDFLLSPKPPNSKLIIVSCLVKAGAEYIYKNYFKTPVNAVVDGFMDDANGTEIAKASISGTFISLLYTISKELTNGKGAMGKLSEHVVTIADKAATLISTVTKWCFGW